MSRPPEHAGQEDLEALFEQVAAGYAPPEDVADSTSRIHLGLGQMARKLHDTLKELGYDKVIAKAADNLPDAQSRLHYVASMTEQAADRALTAVEIARPLQAALQAEADALEVRWAALYAGTLSVEEFKDLADDTRAFLQGVPGRAHQTSEQLLAIMLAQDFQDLTGQVIKRIAELVTHMEEQVIALLIESRPNERRAACEDGLLNGPVVDPGLEKNVVTTQQEVDDLLRDLGF